MGKVFEAQAPHQRMYDDDIKYNGEDNGQLSYDYGHWLILPEIQNHKERFICAVDDINLMLVSKNYGDVC